MACISTTFLYDKLLIENSKAAIWPLKLVSHAFTQLRKGAGHILILNYVTHIAFQFIVKSILLR